MEDVERQNLIEIISMDTGAAGGICADDRREIEVPIYTDPITCDTHKRTGIGLSKLGTGRAISLGAYMFAIDRLENEV